MRKLLKRIKATLTGSLWERATCGAEIAVAQNLADIVGNDVGGGTANRPGLLFGPSCTSQQGGDGGLCGTAFGLSTTTAGCAAAWGIQ